MGGKYYDRSHQPQMILVVKIIQHPDGKEKPFLCIALIPQSKRRQRMTLEKFNYSGHPG
jgi:hypothetical protein